MAGRQHEEFLQKRPDGFIMVEMVRQNADRATSLVRLPHPRGGFRKQHVMVPATARAAPVDHIDMGIDARDGAPGCAVPPCRIRGTRERGKGKRDERRRPSGAVLGYILDGMGLFTTFTPPPCN